MRETKNSSGGITSVYSGLNEIKKIHGRQYYIFVSVKSLQPHLDHIQKTHEISPNLVMATREGTPI